LNGTLTIEREGDQRDERSLEVEFTIAERAREFRKSSSHTCVRDVHAGVLNPTRTGSPPRFARGRVYVCWGESENCVSPSVVTVLNVDSWSSMARFGEVSR
jgi:hypothetical protein